MTTFGYLATLQVILAVIVVTGPAEALVTVTTSVSSPSENVLTYHSVPIDNFAWGMQWEDNSGWDHIEVCQSFFAGGDIDWNVNKITLKAREFGTSVANQGFYLQLWTVDDENDYTGNSLINTQSGMFPDSGLAPGYWTFTFDNVNLPSGQHYAFLLGFDSGPDSQRFVNFVHAYSGYDLYPEGRMFCRMGTPAAWSTMTHLSDRDFDFCIQGIPEPGTLALIVPALLGFAELARRKCRSPKV